MIKTIKHKGGERMEKVFAEIDELKRIILNAKLELGQKSEIQADENQAQIQKLCQKVEELQLENQRQHEEMRRKMIEIQIENQEQHKEWYFQTCGKMMSESGKLEKKLDDMLYQNEILN